MASVLMIMGLYFMSVGGRYPEATLFVLITIGLGTLLTVVTCTWLLPNFFPGWAVWLLGL